MVEQKYGAPLQLRDLALGFGPLRVQEHLSADCAYGVTLLVGDEGAGKTTLLRCLAGELQPLQGSLRWQGQDLTAVRAWRRQVFWRDPRTPWPVVTPLAWMQELRRDWPRWCDADWRAHVAGFGLEPHMAKTMDMLSTGSQRKVLIAAALASGAPLTLLDLPEAALDRASIQYLRQALRAQADVRDRVCLVALYEAWPGFEGSRVLRLATPDS